MKRNIFLLSIILVIGFSFYACNKVNKPVVTITELGHENSKKVVAGEELHIEAQIEAEGKIDKVILEIHPEGHHHKDINAFAHNEWKVDTMYLDFSGLKNATFHKHIEVPTTAEAGEYHFHFTVTDMEGNQTSANEHFNVEMHRN